MDSRGNSLFIHIKDFYNFIRQKGGENSPTTVYYFSVNFYPNTYIPEAGADITRAYKLYVESRGGRGGIKASDLHSSEALRTARRVSFFK